MRAQVHAVASDFSVGACKTGMLATRELVELVAALILEEHLPDYVLDPVMVATSGDRLLDEDAEHAVVEHLLPLCRIATPNLDEAAILTGLEVRDETGMRRAAEALLERGARAALIKGGHLTGDTIVDVLHDGDEFTVFRRPRIATSSTHGTGCTLSAAITAGLAQRRDLHTAVARGLEYVEQAIVHAPGLGHGHGPLNHFVELNDR